MVKQLFFHDFETRATLDLRDSNVYRYIEDDAFAVLMMAYALNDADVRVAIGEDECRQVLAPYLHDENVMLVAHNAGFERVVTSKLFEVDGFLSPERYIDTQVLAAEYGYPQKLEQLGAALGGEEKDSAGTALINFFCKPKPDGTFRTPEEYPEKWLEFIMYCHQDVETLRDVWKRLPHKTPTPAEQEIWIADQHINDRGIRMDRRMARAAVRAAEENALEQELELMTLTEVANPNSQPQMLKWFRSAGLDIGNLKKETVDKALTRDDLTPTVRRALELRQELALVAARKYVAGLKSVSSDGRLRGSFRFYGAHTGRWAGRGVQLHNLPRAHLDTDVEVQGAITDLYAGFGADAQTLKKLIRPLFVGPFIVADYAAIEARVIAWLAGEQWALDAFAAGRDIYVETAERMGGLTRAQGKIAVLALGYQGSIGSLRAMGAEGTDDELLLLVRQWRKANARIVKMWYRMDEVFRYGGSAGRINIHRDGKNRVMELPSGRTITYRAVKAVGDSVAFRDPRKNGAYVTTYGGRLSENATQAVARDLLGDALVRMHKEGLAVVGHVHDEVLVEKTPGLTVDKVVEVMTRPSPWAGGLPVDAEGFSTARYRKG